MLEDSSRPSKPFSRYPCIVAIAIMYLLQCLCFVLADTLVVVVMLSCSNCLAIVAIVIVTVLSNICKSMLVLVWTYVAMSFLLHVENRLEGVQVVARVVVRDVARVVDRWCRRCCYWLLIALC